MTLLYENALPVATLLALVVCVWRFTSILAHLMGMAVRFSERNEAQRDRFYERMIEKRQVEGNPEQAVQMAGMHHSEAINTHRTNINRDARADRAVKVEAKHRTSNLEVGSPLDAQM